MVPGCQVDVGEVFLAGECGQRECLAPLDIGLIVCRPDSSGLSQRFQTKRLRIGSQALPVLWCCACQQHPQHAPIPHHTHLAGG